MARRRSLDEIKAVIDLCSYPGFVFKLSQDGAGDTATAWVQIECPEGVDSLTGKPMPWKARKWKVSFYSTDTEIVQTLWVAVQRAIIHEACELFTFKEAAIFDRHVNVHALAALRHMPDCLEHRDLDVTDEGKALADKVFGGSPTSTVATVSIPPLPKKEFGLIGSMPAKKAPLETLRAQTLDGVYVRRITGGSDLVPGKVYEVDRLITDDLLGTALTVYLKGHNDGYMPENFEFNVPAPEVAEA